jgi:hypothetical protein
MKSDMLNWTVRTKNTLALHKGEMVVLAKVLAFSLVCSAVLAGIAFVITVATHGTPDWSEVSRILFKT